MNERASDQGGKCKLTITIRLPNVVAIANITPITITGTTPNSMLVTSIGPSDAISTAIGGKPNDALVDIAGDNGGAQKLPLLRL